MLFNSYEFILVFLPLVLFGFFILGRRRRDFAIGWLVLCSLFFYAYWRPIYLPLLLASVGLNYAIGRRLAAAAGQRRARILLAGGVAANLGALAYFKYANFVVANVNDAFGTSFAIDQIVLPLAISFYTFQQIAYLVDAARGEAQEDSLVHYGLFVAFFPQLIAGPIVHHREVLQQFAAPSIYRLDQRNLAAGITFFAIGLFKKVALADSVAVYGSPVFAAAGEGTAPSLLEAWGGALAYTLQLYFDFSGYCDMAIGLGLMFNIRLPINFNSPYQAVNIIDFWRRWHITLSNFLRDYLYAGLGGNRRGAARRKANLVMTMLLAGLWHGAGWTFVVWGGLHGIYLAVNHLWHSIRRRFGFPPAVEPEAVGRWTGRLVTLLAVIVGWVIFRAPSLEAASLILQGMIGLNGVILPPSLASPLAPLLADTEISVAHLHLFYGPPQAAWIIALMWLALAAPNSQQLLAYTPPSRGIRLAPPRPVRLRWSPNPAWATLIASIFLYSLTRMSHISEFLYFQF